MYCSFNSLFVHSLMMCIMRGKEKIVLKKDRIDMLRDLAITMYMSLLILLIIVTIYVAILKDLDLK